MGFYGNITNTNRTQFVFDKTYPNRRDMDAAAATDGIFVGRYVLVDYDSLIPEEEENPLEIMDSETYATNFNIDKETYGYNSEGKLIGIGRGWDSTAWQKVYKDETYQYIMIAELNSVVPTFDVKVDAPTVNPVKPHFDEDITNIYYPLHIQPSWGFRVGETEGYSDSKVSVSEKVWNEVIESNILENKVYDGDIYFNKAGFDSVSGYKVEDAGEDKITVLPTGESGQKYNTYETKSQGASDPTIAPDIQELRINLPSLGNTIAQMWDMIYEPIGKGGERNQHVEWDNIAGVRLVEADPNGNGFTYNPDKVNTLAGCINSVHDLMGMIITDDNSIDPEDALTNRIYYREGKYCIKDSYYEFIESDGSEDSEPLTLEDFPDNLFYKNKESYYLENSNTYEPDDKYYLINENEHFKEQPLSSKKWAPGTYYKGNIYFPSTFKLDCNEEPTDGEYYYAIYPYEDFENQPTIITNQWKDGEYCFNPLGCTDETFAAWFPDIKEPWRTVPSDYGIVKKTGGIGLFYVGEKDGKASYLPFDKDDTTNSVLQRLTGIWYIENYSIETSTTTNGDVVEVYDFQKPGTIYPDVKMTYIQLYTCEDNSYWYEDAENGIYQVLKNISALKPEDVAADTYKTFIKFATSNEGITMYQEVATPDIPFYLPNKYYYKDGDNYIFAEEEWRVENRVYYKKVKEPNEVPSGTKFYKKNKYFYEYKIGNYCLDSNETATEGRIYYLDPPSQKYVIADENGYYSIGAKWNNKIEEIPDGITIGIRVEKYKWKELEGFARNLNTIHGMILKINKILKSGDFTTRDTTTIQGCINSINDIINKVDELKPGNTLIVDNYGRISSAEVNDDDWIAVSVDPSALTVSVIHKDPVEEIHEAKTAVTPKFGETFNITDYWFDDKGHKNEETTHIVTIPQGSLIDVAANGQDVITQLSFEPTAGVLSTTRINLSAIKVDENTTLGGRLTGIDTGISEETVARETKDNDLQSQIITLSQSISDETSTRAESDSALVGDIADLVEQVTSLEENYLDKSDLNTSSISYISGEETKTSTLSEMLQDIELIKTNFNKLLDVLSSSGTSDFSDLYL